MRHNIVVEDDVHLDFFGCTLHFRGDITAQPLHDEHDNQLLWNGEIFGGIEVMGD